MTYYTHNLQTLTQAPAAEKGTEYGALREVVLLNLSEEIIEQNSATGYTVVGPR